MTSLCALMLDEQEGPIRKEPELLMQVMEWSQDATHPFYRHGARILSELCDGFAMTDDSEQVQMLSKMKLTELLKFRIPVEATVKRVKEHLDDIINLLNDLLAHEGLPHAPDDDITEG